MKGRGGDSGGDGDRKLEARRSRGARESERPGEANRQGTRRAEDLGPLSLSEIAIGLSHTWSEPCATSV